MSEVGSAQRSNAVPEISFFRDEYTIAADMILSINHGLPKKPRQVWMKLVNQIAEFQYNPGDEVYISSAAVNTAYNPCQISANNTTINATFVGLPLLLDNTGGAGSVTASAITAANWTLVIVAEI